MTPWLGYLDAQNFSYETVSAYRRDVIGIAGRVAPNAQVTALRLLELTPDALRSGFASWSEDHGYSSMHRAHSAWRGFFDFLVARRVVVANPMAALPRPRSAYAAARAVSDPTLAPRLLGVAAVPDGHAHNPWPERDVALVALFCLTGLWDRELVSLNVGSMVGPPGDRHLEVAARGRTVAVPIAETLDVALDRYLASRSERCPDRRFSRRASPLFLDRHGSRLSTSQLRYLMNQLRVRAGVDQTVSAGALVRALRHTLAVDAPSAADIIDLPTVASEPQPQPNSARHRTPNAGHRTTRPHSISRTA